MRRCMPLTIVIILITAGIISSALAQSPLAKWEKETDLQTRFILASQIVSQWPGSLAAEKVAESSFSDQRYSEDQRFQLARSYFEGLDQTNQNGKYKQRALTILGASPGTTQLLPATMHGLQDSGSFTIYSGNKQVGSAQFNWAATGAYDSICEQTQNGIKNTQTTKIEVDDKGYWTKVASTIPMGGAVTIERTGAVVRARYPSAPSAKGTILPNTIIVNPNTDPALLTLAARLYDTAKGGTQFISVMVTVFPSANRAALERKNVYTIPGTSDTYTKYALIMYPFPPTSFWVNGSGKVVVQELPAVGPSGARTFVRPGAEELIGH